jgi:hypothetical protein
MVETIQLTGDECAVAQFGVTPDCVGDTAMISADYLAQILGIEAGGQRRRAGEVAERHRQLAPLRLGCGVRRGRGRHVLRRGTPRTGRKASDRFQQ